MSLKFELKLEQAGLSLKTCPWLREFCRQGQAEKEMKQQQEQNSPNLGDHLLAEPCNTAVNCEASLLIIIRQ